MSVVTRLAAVGRAEGLERAGCLGAAVTVTFIKVLASEYSSWLSWKLFLLKQNNTRNQKIKHYSKIGIGK